MCFNSWQRRGYYKRPVNYILIYTFFYLRFFRRRLVWYRTPNRIISHHYSHVACKQKLSNDEGDKKKKKDTQRRNRMQLQSLSNPPYIEARTKYKRAHNEASKHTRKHLDATRRGKKILLSPTFIHLSRGSSSPRGRTLKRFLPFPPSFLQWMKRYSADVTADTSDVITAATFFFVCVSLSLFLSYSLCAPKLDQFFFFSSVCGRRRRWSERV